MGCLRGPGLCVDTQAGTVMRAQAGPAPRAPSAARAHPAEGLYLPAAACGFPGGAGPTVPAPGPSSELNLQQEAASRPWVLHTGHLSCLTVLGTSTINAKLNNE